MTTRRNVTGRDGSIIVKALAYAIETIERLPEDEQEWSDNEDMKSCLPQWLATSASTIGHRSAQR